MNTEEKLINEANAFNRGMLENTIKIMSGKFGGGFYVNYQFDKMNGMGFLKLILEYPDGDVFAIPMCKNVGKNSGGYLVWNFHLWGSVSGVA